MLLDSNLSLSQNCISKLQHFVFTLNGLRYSCITYQYTQNVSGIVSIHILFADKFILLHLLRFIVPFEFYIVGGRIFSRPAILPTWIEIKITISIWHLNLHITITPIKHLAYKSVPAKQLTWWPVLKHIFYFFICPDTNPRIKFDKRAPIRYTKNQFWGNLNYWQNYR